MSTLTPQEVRRFRRHVAALNALIVEVRQRIPAAGYYLANDNLHLMSGDSHEGGPFKDKPRQERVMVSERLRFSGGGDW